jgi:threonine/homoserine/homoserine lactone efflux protein
MFEPTLLPLYLAALAAVFLAPGPDMALIVATAASHGARAGLRTALGIAAARYVHVLAAGLGLAALLAAHPPLLAAVRGIGAVYLLWLAWKILRPGTNQKDSAPRPENAALASGAGTNTVRPYASQKDASQKDVSQMNAQQMEAEQVDARRANALGPDMRRGFFTNLLNPKALLFCGLLLPQFVTAARGPLLPQFLCLGAILVGVGLLFDAAYSLLASGLMRRLRQRTAACAAMDRARRWLMGSTFAALAARLMLG